MHMPSKETRERLIRILSIITLVVDVFATIAMAALIVLTGMAVSIGGAQELAEALNVSVESAVIHTILGFSLALLSGILGIIRSVKGIRSRTQPVKLKAFTTLSEAILALDGVSVIWGFSMGSYGDARSIVSAIFGLLFNAFMVWLGLYSLRDLTEEDEKLLEIRKIAKERRKLGFIRLIQFSYAANIIFSFTMLTFITRDEMAYSYMTAVDWINLTFDVVCFWLIWRRLRIARTAIITLSALNMVLNTIQYMFFSEKVFAAFVISLLIDVFVIVYFLFSKRPQMVLVNEISYERPEVDLDDDDSYIAKKGWPRWRNLLLYYCVFSVLGHWMELGFCMLIRAGLVAGEYDPSNTMLWRDLLFPFPMEGIAVVICALWLYPLKQRLLKRFGKPYIPLVLSFLANGAVCTLMELIGGLLVNADHSLWDYSDMFCNFMGQICLQNAIGFGLACTLIVWIVYPLLERIIARIPNDVMNLIFVGAITFNLILQILYLVEPLEIANAFNQLGAMLSNRA